MMSLRGRRSQKCFKGTQAVAADCIQTLEERALLTGNVIASLNGTTEGNWTGFAKQIEKAGANALELNIYNIPTDFNLSPAQIEETYIQILKSVKSAVKIPVALKLSPYFTNMAYAAKKFDDAGANALVFVRRHVHTIATTADQNTEISRTVLNVTRNGMR